MNKSDISPTLRPIKDHIDNFRKLAAWLIALGIFPPLLQLWLQIGPPWPHSGATATYSNVALWAVMLWTFSQWYSSSRARLNTLVAKFLIPTAACLVMFVGLMAFFAVDAPTSKNQIAKGFFMHDRWVQILNDDRFPAKSERDLLAANEWDAYAIYPAWTVNLVRFALLILWVLSFALLGGSTSVFVLWLGKLAASDKVSKPSTGRVGGFKA